MSESVRIKLAANKRSSKTIEELASIYPRNPLNPRQLVIMTADETLLAIVTLQPDPEGGVHLSEIRTPTKGAGFASEALNIICATASRCGEDITLIAKPFAPGLSEKKLVQWYERHGFVIEGPSDDGPSMIRKGVSPDAAPGVDEEVTP